LTTLNIYVYVEPSTIRTCYYY